MHASGAPPGCTYSKATTIACGSYGVQIFTGSLMLVGHVVAAASYAFVFQHWLMDGNCAELYGRTPHARAILQT
jgi:hypothetical protein